MTMRLFPPSWTWHRPDHRPCSLPSSHLANLVHSMDVRTALLLSSVRSLALAHHLRTTLVFRRRSGPGQGPRNLPLLARSALVSKSSMLPASLRQCPLPQRRLAPLLHKPFADSPPFIWLLARRRTHASSPHLRVTLTRLHPLSVRPLPTLNLLRS